MEVLSGIIFGLLGPNGAGKTATFHLLLGLLEPTAGRAEVLGFDTRTQADQVRTHTGALLLHSGILAFDAQVRDLLGYLDGKQILLVFLALLLVVDMAVHATVTTRFRRYKLYLDLRTESSV